MLAELGYFTGTENYYKNFLGLVYTDGLKYVAEEAGAYWLIDAIASYQADLKKHEFQSWTLKQNPDKSWTLKATDGNDRVLVKQEIEFSDFPIGQISLYVSNNVLMLPSEY